MIAAHLLTLGLSLGPPALQDTAPDAPVVTASGELVAETTVGMRVRLEELPLPGSELRPVPVPDPGKAEVILRVVNVFPHGSGFRYNLEVTPFVTGTLDLRDHLERVDGTSTEDLPPLRVAVSNVLAPDGLLPNDLDPTEPPGVGGYGTKLKVGIALWFVGLLALLFVGRKGRAAEVLDADGREPTLAERLRPLVEEARDGSLSDGERARLERLLLAHWRERRDLQGVGVAEAVSRLRRDPEAGPLFLALERWLHSKDGGGGADDIAALLAPYRDVDALAPHPAREGAPRP